MSIRYPAPEASREPVQTGASRKTFATRSKYLLAAAGVVPALLAFAAYRTGSEHIATVTRTIAVDNYLRSLDELYSTVQDAETGQRGFLLTGSLRYLEPYLMASKRVPYELNQLQNSARVARVDLLSIQDLQKVIDDKMHELALTVTLARQSRPREALAEVMTDRGQQEMAQIRSTVTALKLKQEQIFQASLKAQQVSQERLNLLLGFGVVLVFLLLLLGYWSNRRYIQGRDEVEREIRTLNQTLEERVAQRTADLTLRTQELESGTAELKRANADLMQFAYIASHDLQEPLRMVASYMGMLERRYRDQFDQTAIQYIDFAINGAVRMQSLVNDLLQYARVGTQAVQTAPVGFASLIDQAAENLQLVIEENQAHIECGTLPEVQADETKLLLVIQNLIGNALKFRKPDVSPVLRISAELANSEWLFRFADNGIGFDPKYSDRIFMVFQRLHNKNSYPGNGIGLAICRRIIEHHGGRLWAESELGVGSIFCFTLPATPDSKMWQAPTNDFFENPS